MKHAILLAAGKGSRMNSSINKVMHKVVDKPIIGHLVDKLEDLKVDSIEVVVGYQQEQIRDYLKDRVSYSVQENPVGTADAIKQIQSLKDKTGQTIILVGDAPLVQKETMESLFNAGENADCVILTAQLSDPKHYGRIIRDNTGEVKAIVEYKDLNEEQKNINEIFTGVMVVDNKLLFENIYKVNNENSKQEYYHTDLVKILSNQNHMIKALKVNDVNETMGVNDRIQLASANKWLQNKINEGWMENGVSLIDPNNIYISSEAQIEADVTIYPNVFIKGQTIIHSGSTIYPGSWIENSTIGKNTVIDHSKVIDSSVGDNSTVGPYSHLRMHAEVKNHVRIGNFNEIKNSIIKNDSRMAHLSYVGDSEIGEDVNIGCGVVTVNYDGKNKFKTIVKDHAFIGSNSNLIAPITIGEYGVVAAGSTISKDLNDGDMVIERSQSIIKEQKGYKYIKKEGK